ncbi:hypothetical protein MPSEU_000366800 [Mayamaea pseudoterrestris]|nr:hypothetical protein MPSEU_000366800 [Mayamaea pseudoterrestris]
MIAMSSQAARKAWNEAMKATAGSALSPALQQHATKRRSGRTTKQKRRAKARRVTVHDEGNSEYRAAIWMDALEEADLMANAEMDDDEFDELEELQGGTKRSKKKVKLLKKGVIPKRFVARSLAAILLDDASKDDGPARDFMKAEAMLPKDRQVPARKFCPVTGLGANYREPKSSIYFASMEALVQIRERSPPWIHIGGCAAYHDCTKCLVDDGEG